MTTRLYAHPEPPHSFGTPTTEVERRIAEIWQAALSLDRIGLGDSLFELGGDSVMAARIINRVNQTYGVRIDLEEAYDDLTVRSLAIQVDRQLAASVDEMDDEEVARRLAELDEEDVS